MSDIEEKPQSALQLTERPQDVRKRLERVFAIPDLVAKVCEHVANGGSLLDLCRMWAVSYGRVLSWIYAQPDGRHQYERALEHRVEWADEMTLADIHTYAQADVRDLFDSDGRPLLPHELPDNVAIAVQSVDVVERTDENGGHTITHKIKLVDKLKARDMILRTRGKYIDKVEHSGSVSLEQIIAGSWKKEENND